MSEAYARYRAAVEDADLAPIQAKIAQLDRERDLLNRKALALANADKPEILSKLAEGVLAVKSTHLQCLRADYDKILKEAVLPAEISAPYR